MKKVLLIIIVVVVSNLSFGQAFEKGNKNFDLNLGIAGYGTKVTFKDANSGLELSTTDGAASSVVGLDFEYGISNRFGLGVQLNSSNYFIDKEDSTNVTESVRAVDFALKFNFHLLNADRNDLFISLGLGTSGANWTFVNSNDTYSGSGTYFTLGLTDRIYFGEHVGILFHLGYAGYNYNNLDHSGDNKILENLQWSLKGVNFGTGLAVKF